MKPSELELRLSSTANEMLAVDTEHLSQQTSLIELKQAEIRSVLHSLSLQEDSGELKPEELALAYASAITRHCNYGGDENNSKSAEINIARDSLGILGSGLIKAVVTARASVQGRAKKVRPEKGGRVSEYVLVVGFVPTSQVLHASTEFSHSRGQVALGNKMPSLLYAPDNTQALLEVETIKDFDSYSPIVSEDFLDWAKILLQRATDPALAPTLYNPPKTTLTMLS